MKPALSVLQLPYFALSLLLLLLLPACKKEAGEGGTSYIQGKVWASYYNKNFSLKAASRWAGDVDVYIIYGDEVGFSDKIKTSYDGTYQFKFLRNGSYKIYTYSRDSSGSYKNQANQYAPDIAILKTVEITERKQTVEVPQINIIQ